MFRGIKECENSIIFAILERARWKSNDNAYFNGKSKSIFTRMLVGTECLHDKLGRYNSSEQHPFTDIMLDREVDGDRDVEGNDFLSESKMKYFLNRRHMSININNTILENYFKKVLPKITKPGSDDNLVSVVTADINLLQVISRRIHLGKLVAQIKYNEEPKWYRQSHTELEITEKLTNKEVEETILERVGEKQKKIMCLVNDEILECDCIKEIYRDLIIPLTKQVEIRYFRLLNS